MSMSIRTKLCLIVGLFLIPIALLSWLFIAQSRKDISFSALERQGVAELQTAWSAFESFVADTRGLGAGAAADMLATMADPSARAPVSEGATGAMATLKSTATIHEKMASLRSFIATIGDSSNLILDPDLDSYYLMDIAVIRMPELMEKAAFTENALVELAPKATLSDDEKASYVMLLGSLSSADEQLTNSFAAGLTGNADGSIKTNLDAANNAFHDEVTRFSATMKAAWDDLKLDDARAKVDVAAIKADYQRLVTAANDYHKLVSADLDRLLANRIGGFNFTLVTMLTISLGVTLAALVTAIFLARSIMQSINRLDFGIRRLGDTSINAEIAEANGADEIAQLARAVVYFRDRTIERLEAANSDERKRELLAGQRKALSGVAENIRGSVGKVSKAIADLALGIRATSENVATNSTKTRNDLGHAINRLATSSSDVNVVVSAVTELASSIQEISDRTARSAEETALARSRTARVASVGERLSDSSARIGEISALIAQIAQQTNLLALNATIEAARAGEAGRGFAVVASEVKQLASQTARATEEIERQVQEVRTAANDVLSAVGDMSGTVENIANLSVSIAGAVEEQSVATNEITSSLDRSVDANRNAVESLSDLPNVAASTERAAAELAQMSHMLVSETSTLDQEVTRLLADLTNDNQPPSTSPLAA